MREMRLPGPSKVNLQVLHGIGTSTQRVAVSSIRDLTVYPDSSTGTITFQDGSLRRVVNPEQIQRAMDGKRTPLNERLPRTFLGRASVSALAVGLGTMIVSLAAGPAAPVVALIGSEVALFGGAGKFADDLRADVTL